MKSHTISGLTKTVSISWDGVKLSLVHATNRQGMHGRGLGRRKKFGIEGTASGGIASDLLVGGILVVPPKSRHQKESRT